MRHPILAAIPVALALVSWSAAADICDDIDDVASGWAAVADALENTADEEVGDLDVERLKRDVNALLEPTELLANALIELGNADEEALGAELFAQIAELHDVEGDDLAAYMVDRIDDITAAVDDVVDYCDQTDE